MLASNKVCTCGNSSRDSLPKIINYFVGKKTKAIVNGFDYQRIDGIELKAENKRHFKKSSEVKIVYIGALNNKKNQIALLKSVKLINMSLEIIFLGDGANRNVLVNYSKNNNINISIDKN